MAIDKKQYKDLINMVNSLFDNVLSEFSPDVREKIRSLVLSKVIEEMEDLIGNSRPPNMFLVGRSGHGKSSLINALANRPVAVTGDVKPTTAEARPYLIVFPDSHAAWNIIDSRGLFETIDASQKSDISPLEQAKKEITMYNPDVIMHVIAAPELRNLRHDIEAFREIQSALRHELGNVPPTIMVLTKVDVLGNPRDWPPEKSQYKAGLIYEALRYAAENIIALPYQFVDPDNPIKGILFKDSVEYIGVIPVCALLDEKWNIETLSELIGEVLPRSALLDFFQAQKRKALLKKLSTSLIKRFSTIAMGIGAIPIPVSDILLLTPLQMVMIALIGGLSCRNPDTGTVAEFMTAAGINTAAAMGLRALARQLVKLVPFLGDVISGGIAYSGTYAIGKAAEAYYFEDEVKKPEEFEKEAQEEYNQLESK